jgi:regulatory protein
MKITKIEVTKKGRYALFVDDSFLFSVPEEVMVSAHLDVGKEVDVRQLEELRHEAELRLAKDRALRLLGGKGYSRKQLKEKLLAHADEEIAEEAVLRMEELGLVDDEAYAFSLARDYFHLKGFAPARIRQELQRRGIPGELAKEASEQFEEESRDERMKEVILRRYRKDLFDDKGRTKVLGGLARMGYSYEDSKRMIAVVREELEELGEGPWQ